MRDLQKDLELCSEFQREIIDNLPKYEVADILKFGRADLINRFHKECREGWPYAIERALESEALARELMEALGGLSYYVTTGEIDTPRFYKDFEVYGDLLDKSKEVLGDE